MKSGLAMGALYKRGLCICWYIKKYLIINSHAMCIKLTSPVLVYEYGAHSVY